jgi:cytochrome c oxidase subunit 2
MSSSPRTRSASGNLWGWLLVALAVGGTVLAFVTGAINRLFPPAAATEQGKQIRDLYDIVFYVAAVIFFVVEGLIIWTVVRYRRRPGDDELPPQTHGNNLAEITWTVVPTIIVAFLFFISWQTLNSVDAVTKAPQMRVHVTGAQFQWTFEYLDENGNKLFTQSSPTGAKGGLFLPVGQSIQVELSSPDVIHSFYVPQFLFKRDANPGPVHNRFEFTIDPSFAGQTIHGQCAELCGTGHRVMLFDVHPMTATDFAAWRQQKIDEAKASPKPSASGAAPSGPAASGPPASGAPAAALKLAAKDIAYDTKSLEVAAGQPFSIQFTNNDPAGVAHDVQIRGQDGSVLQSTDKTDGGQSATYNYQPLQPGTYTYICSIHPIPAMTGTLTVK